MFLGRVCLRVVCPHAYKDKQVRVHATRVTLFLFPAPSQPTRSSLPSSTTSSPLSQALSFTTVSHLLRRTRSVLGVRWYVGSIAYGLIRLHFSLLIQGVNEFCQLTIRFFNTRHTNFALANARDTTQVHSTHRSRSRTAPKSNDYPYFSL